MALSILHFPPEIREQIYRECLRIPKIVDAEGLPHYVPDLSILRVNRLIHKEAIKIFQDDNILLKITTPWPEASRCIINEGKVPRLMTGKRAAAFDKVHLHIRMEGPGNTPTWEDHSLIILAEDLPAFIQIWVYSDLNYRGLNGHLGVCLYLQDPHVPDRKVPKTLQQRLLLPFGKIKDLREFDMKGMILPSVKEALESESRIPNPSPEECLDKASDLKDTGNDLIRSKKYTEALQAYFDAFAAMHIAVNGRERTVYADGYFAHECSTGRFANQRADYVRMLLRVKLVANIVLTYLKLDEYDEAYFWGKRTIILFQKSISSEEYAGYPSESDWIGTPVLLNFGAASEMGKIYFRTAQAAREVGKQEEVIRLLRAAAAYLPRDEAVHKELRELEAQEKTRKEEKE